MLRQSRRCSQPASLSSLRHFRTLPASPNWEGLCGLLPLSSAVGFTGVDCQLKYMLTKQVMIFWWSICSKINPKLLFFIFLILADEQTHMVTFLVFSVNHSPFVFYSQQIFLTGSGGKKQRYRKTQAVLIPRCTATYFVFNNKCQVSALLGKQCEKLYFSISVGETLCMF